MNLYFLPLTASAGQTFLTGNRIFGIILFLVGLWNLIHPTSARKIFTSWNRRNAYSDPSHQTSTRSFGVGCILLGILIFLL